MQVLKKILPNFLVIVGLLFCICFLYEWCILLRDSCYALQEFCGGTVPDCVTDFVCYLSGFFVAVVVVIFTGVNLFFDFLHSRK